MSEIGSSVNSINEELSDVLVYEKGRNKRKFLPESLLDISAGMSTLSLSETLEEKFRNALSKLGHMNQRSEDTFGEQGLEADQDTDWDDPIASELEELLTNNLTMTFSTAVKKIVECGYTEKVAEWAVLNSSLFHGSKDAVSNVVDPAMALLKKEKEFSTPRHPVFDGLKSLVDFTLLEMIQVLREVRSDLTVAEAMWALLISDLNLVNACILGGTPAVGLSTSEASGESPNLSQSKSEALIPTESDSKNSGIIQLTVKLPVASPSNQLSTCKPGNAQLVSPREESSPTLQEAKGNPSSVDEKSGGSKKGLSSNSKRDMLRHKSFQFEKNYKGRSKGSFKRFAAWGSMVLEKSPKSQSSSSSALMKGTISQITTASGTTVHGELGFSDKGPVIALPAAIPKSHKSSVPEKNSCSKGEISVCNTPKAIDYYASIPFDETLQKHIPRDDKDEAILMLVPHKQALEKELHGWMDWANEKVMQAARRLGKDLGELKMLRQEKEELEKYKKDKQALEESTMKRLSEMEYALSNATGQIKVANCAVHRLEEENDVLKDEMEAAKMKALRSASDLQKAVVREQEYHKRLQTWEAEKSLILEQMTNLKRQIVALKSRLAKAKERQDQFKILLNQEEKEKLKALKQIDSFSRRIEEEDALMQVEMDSIKQMAEADKKKCEDSIKNLKNMISELRMESDKSKIAALNVGYYGNIPGPKITKRLAVFQDDFGGGEVSPERECVMCMTDEISVVFLPCAHQVLCDKCSIQLEEQGMNECPSCRTTIQRRVSVTYRTS